MSGIKRSPLFIIGYPRPGTTLLQSLLGVHSQIHLVNEPELVRGLRSTGLNIHDRFQQKDYPRILEDLSAVIFCQKHFSHLPPGTLAQFVEYGGTRTFKEVYEFLLPKPAGVAVWGEKSLGNAFYMRDLRELYPDALFVHIVRDPRAALLSSYRKKFARSAPCEPPFDPNGIQFFAYYTLRWLTWINLMNGAQSLSENDVIQLRYEELITEPERWLKRICSALGLEFDPGMLDLDRRRKDPVVVSKKDLFAHTRLSEPINPGIIGRSDELPEWACYIVERYAGRVLTELGYSVSRRQPGMHVKLKVSAELYNSEGKLRARLEKETASRRGPRQVTVAG